ncbi:probable NAD(P)H dehydrogenase (quinone) FQR1-like 2 [Populus trichocarpa]|uniref:probable NAD(P)H dehydrogenase (quinone) FQR1-like 2 n=1 Tax=Populus trichocarpa TaxID=3694 RepID=UPI0022799B4D|nr:probable NAD(P)H dehydrogenase (quinone) FQR1-like 2 [Populus trichocarpa]
MARRIKKGVDSTPEVEGVLHRIPETLPNRTSGKMKVPQKRNEVPLVKVDELVNADGCSSEQMQQECLAMELFLHLLVPWKYPSDQMALTVITQLVHHGMVFVPIGHTFGAGMFRMDSIRGGSPCGAEVLSGDGTREPSEIELAFVEHQGKYMAKVVKRFAWPFSFAPGENHN